MTLIAFAEDLDPGADSTTHLAPRGTEAVDQGEGRPWGARREVLRRHSRTWMCAVSEN